MAAGLGYKEFATGDVLTAADANGYLASQVVMVFASAAARTSAIASPQEGMMLNNAYIAGTDVDIAHMILQSMVDHIEVSALEKYNDQ